MAKQLRKKANTSATGDPGANPILVRFIAIQSVIIFAILLVLIGVV